MKKALSLLIAAALAFAGAPADPAEAQSRGRGPSLIRDAEIEAILKAYSDPVLQAAGLAGSGVRIHIVNATQINAFVAGGRHIFLNAGLLMRAENADQVVGVIAHEAGHIAHSDLVKLRNEIQDAQIKQIISFILAAGAGVAARDSQAALGALLLGQQVAERSLYQFTRTQEAAADQFALSVLDRMGVSAKGLQGLLNLLAREEAITVGRGDPYMRTHPITQSRLEAVNQHLARSPHANRTLPANLQVMHQRMRAKLIGFLLPPEQVGERYRGRENTMEARYALAVAYHRRANLPRSLELMDSLLREQPNDAYFHELRGQILFESGDPRRAAESYERAVRARPQEAQIRVGLAQAQIATDDPARLDAAIAHLREALRRDDTYAQGWYHLAVAYGKRNRGTDAGESALALAEYYYLVQELNDLRVAIARAERLLPAGSPSWQRLQDLKSFAAQVREDRRRNR